MTDAERLERDAALAAVAPGGSWLWLVGLAAPPGSADLRVLSWPCALFDVDSADEASLATDLADLWASLPCGLAVLGAVACVKSSGDDVAAQADALLSRVGTLLSSADLSLTPQSGAIVVDDAGAVVERRLPSMAPVSDTDFTTFRVSFQFTVAGDAPDVDAHVASWSRSLRFLLPNNTVLPTDDTLLSAALASPSKTKPTSAPVLLRALSSFAADGGALMSPLVTVDSSETRGTRLVVLDVCAVASLDTSCASLHASLVHDGLPAQLRATHLLCNASPPRPVGVFHFGTASARHLVTGVFPLSASAGGEASYLDQRVRLHRRFHVAPDRPAFRRMAAVRFGAPSSGTSTDGKLRTVHAGLAGSGVPGGAASLVDGDYVYYHYMQDNFDDNGWGCSYRSFQTICSWFLLHDYTSVATPTHKQIQQTLVALGDKPPAFVGSRDWIGSLEISFLLDHFYGVTCRILRLESGAEFPTRARELAHHFETQGTPVMIGGGVLAYTLLGVDLNERTGAVKFLILDPHYTGSENLKTIQDKGWVGWKGPELFRKDAFYNLCLPLRPKMV